MFTITIPTPTKSKSINAEKSFVLAYKAIQANIAAIANNQIKLPFKYLPAIIDTAKNINDIKANLFIIQSNP